MNWQEDHEKRVARFTIPAIELDVPHDRSYVPEQVKRSVGHITPEQYKVLRSALGLFSAREARAEREMETLRMRVDQVWYLNPCGPDCCTPQLVLQIGVTDFLYLTGACLSVFQPDKGEILKPIHRNLEVIRSLRTHIPLHLTGTGEPLQVSEINTSNANEQDMFTAPFKYFRCEFLKSDTIALALGSQK